MTDGYDNGYQAGIRCDAVPDDASDEFMLGYADGLDIDHTLTDATKALRECLRLTVIHSPNTGTFYIASTSGKFRLLVTGKTLSAALADVPQALLDLRAAGAEIDDVLLKE